MVSGLFDTKFTVRNGCWVVTRVQGQSSPILNLNQACFIRPSASDRISKCSPFTWMPHLIVWWGKCFRTGRALNSAHKHSPSPYSTLKGTWVVSLGQASELILFLLFQCVSVWLATAHALVPKVKDHLTLALPGCGTWGQVKEKPELWPWRRAQTGGGDVCAPPIINRK